MKYVNNNIHIFILLPSFVLSFIYSYIYVLTPFFKLDVSDAGWTLPPDHMRAIQEELAAFFLDHMIDKHEEYHVDP